MRRENQDSKITVRTIQRMNLKSWYTNLQQKPRNRCQQVQVPYKRLIQDENKTDKRTSNNYQLMDRNRPMTNLTRVLQPLP